MGFYCEAPIYRVTGLIIEDFQLYTGRHRDRNTFEAFGGKAEMHEDPIDALVRELFEEAQVKIDGERVRRYDRYIGQADGDGRPMLIDAYLIGWYEGTIVRNNEIAEIRQIHSESGLLLGPTLGGLIVPQLVRDGLMH